ncbi:MAG: hypothetical protein H0V17_32255 [Deltaproteobacteria bacterium]|nr:hypothetical protein [Deltaproteobacteria bacterium]
MRWFNLTVLDVVDVVVSKIARFDATDRSDIDAMIRKGLVDHAVFIERFRDAVDERSGAASADQLPKYVERLHTIERDMFGEDETDIELPSWI